jgi:N-acetylmuramoyl-L-alanine amidase
MSILYYLCKVVLCSAVLYGYYHVLLRNRRFHYYNRYYLLLATVVSLLLPLLQVPLSFTGATAYPLVYKALQVVAVTKGEQEEIVTAAVPGMSASGWMVAGYLLYSVVSISLLLLLLRSFLYIRRLTKRYSYTWLGNRVRVFNTSERGTPFSFFNSIYWNNAIEMNSEEGRQVLQHELFHVKERHTMDLLFIECCCILCWFNPFFFLIRRELKAIHEFLADEYAVTASDPHVYMEFLVLKAIDNRNNALGHYFFQSHLKRRINMLLHYSKKRYSYASRLLVLPLSLLLFCAIALYARPVVNGQEMVVAARQPLTIVIDAGHGGTDPGIMSADGLKEKDLVLALAKKIKLLSPAYQLNVVLTRENDELPGSNTGNGIKNRVLIAEKAGASLFISLHVNNEEEANTGKGFDVYVPSEKRGNAYKAQARQFGELMVASLKNVVMVKEQLQQRETQGIFVLDHAVCPAILIECGYIHNTDDMSFLEKEQNQELVARRILAAAVAYANKIQ